MTLGVVGLGLIGTSMARAALKRGACRRVLGLDPDPEHVALFAEFDGCEVVAEAAGLDGVDMVAIATPPDRVLDALTTLDPKQTTFDVASVKAPIARAVPDAYRPTFVGTHPIAGNEGKGPAASDPHLFVDRLWVVTPGSADHSHVDRVEAFARSLGATTKLMSAQEHDAWLALTSHLPNLLANILVTLSPDGREPFEGPSWRSATRVAGGNPELWATILSMNAPEVSRRIAEVQDALAHAQKSLDDREALAAWLSEATCA